MLAALLAVGGAAARTAKASKAGDCGTDVPTLNIAIGAGTVTFGPVYIALVEGLFQRNCVNVNVVNNNAVAVQGALLVGGQVDLIVSASSGAAAIHVAGQPTKFIMDLTNYDYRTLALIGSGKLQTLADIQAAGSNCRVGVANPGTAAYGYWKIVQAAFNIQCSVSTFATTPAVVASIVSGQTDAVISGPIDAVNLGKLHYPVILNPFNMSKDIQQKVAPSSYPFGVVAGLDQNLQSKKDAVVRFITAMRQALALTQGLKVPLLGDITSRDTAAFPGTTAASLAQTWSLVKHQVPTGPTAGTITSAAYTALLNGLIAGQQANISTTDPNQSYASEVDMSYFNASTPVPLCRQAVKATKGHKGRPAQRPSLKYICRMT
jgi:ABC-type nitrate/sulfonate/bicarbonate transport system substrate-binding protein